MKIKIGDREFDAQLAAETVTVDGESFAIRIVRHEKTLTVYVNEKPFAVQLPDPLPEEGAIELLVDAKTYAVEASGATAAAPRPKAARKSSATATTGAVVSQMTGRIVQHLKDQGTITVAEARTMFDTSRKYVLPLLEHMDQQQITRRTGDERVLR